MSFEVIYNRAATRKGGVNALEALLQDVTDQKTLSHITDDRYLSLMTRCVFNSGLTGKSSPRNGQGSRTPLWALMWTSYWVRRMTLSEN